VSFVLTEKMTLESKVCSKCCEEKPRAAFSRRGTGLQPVCRECRKVCSREHYEQNKQYYVDRARSHKKELAGYLRDLKHMQPCVDCRERFPHYVLQFDHRDPGTKAGNVAHLPKRGSKALIDAEIAKCDLVCANCHAERTHQRRTGGRLIG
jgi:hypothetical protein